MATEHDRTHAKRLLAVHKRNLERLELQKAELGGELNIALENQIDQERANIAALEPLVKPPPEKRVQDFVARVSDDNWAMMFTQFVLLNTRMTKAEEQNQAIIEQQSRASIDRMQTNERLDRIETQVVATEQARVTGVGWWRRVALITLSMALLALLVSCAALAAVLR